MSGLNIVKLSHPACPDNPIPRKEDPMSTHVHVRVNYGMAVTEDGDLIEEYRCGCGATWTRVHRADEGYPEH